MDKIHKNSHENTGDETIEAVHPDIVPFQLVNRGAGIGSHDYINRTTPFTDDLDASGSFQNRYDMENIIIIKSWEIGSSHGTAVRFQQ